MRRFLLFFLWMVAFQSTAYAQASAIKGSVYSQGETLEFVNIYLVEKETGTVTDQNGTFEFNDLKAGTYTIRASYIGYLTEEREVRVLENESVTIDFDLQRSEIQTDEVVVTGTLREITRSNSPVPVEVFSPSYFQMNPTPSLFEAMQNVNGVRPQLNCNVCNTGDIHINGLEGPYTMVLIDGMPIVSGLSTVYGLFAIPNSMVERVEIVKGPASTLYGSEAVGGLINVITKKSASAPAFIADAMFNNWGEGNLDLGGTFDIGDKATVLTGANYFNYSNPIDNNADNFTDVTLQQRVSLFQKWNINRESGKLFTLAGRFLYEDRWGGEMDWDRSFRGSDQVYGESIYTTRWELLGSYQLPTEENLLLSFSYNDHYQDSYYGDMLYIGDQRIGFGQLTWDKALKNHNLLVGTALRYTYYDDNTPATAAPQNINVNNPDEIWLPGIFVQDEIELNSNHDLLLGLRYDYNSVHGNIWTPRFAYKWDPTERSALRLNAGTGFRVVNLFTEDHAALTGAREVVIEESLQPEQSYNLNLNYEHRFFGQSGNYLRLDASSWYTYFTNQILPDYETNANQIRYANLDGFSVTRGASLNLDFEHRSGLKILAGASFIDMFVREDDIRFRPVLTERWMGTWGASYTFRNAGLKVDYTGNLYGPMRLPLISDTDPRAAFSPWWSIQNIQLTWSQPESRFEWYGGVKNLLNYTPPANSIARAFDPFDSGVVFDNAGGVVPTPDNPNALTFDPSYMFAPNQGIRGFLGFRYKID